MTHGSLALKLRVLRAERALTIEQAAAKAGVTPETISDAERGRRHPYLPTLRKLATAYDVPVEELLEAEEPVLAGAPGKAGAPATGRPEDKAPDPLDGWIGRALSEGDFVLEFERAKGSQELADELHRAKHTEAIERQQRVDTLKEHHAPPAEILEARRDRAVANAQLTAAALLAVELWRGHDVSGMDPRATVTDVIHTQSGEFLTGGRPRNLERAREQGRHHCTR